MGLFNDFISNFQKTSEPSEEEGRDETKRVIEEFLLNKRFNPPEREPQAFLGIPATARALGDPRIKAQLQSAPGQVAPEMKTKDNFTTWGKPKYTGSVPEKIPGPEDHDPFDPGEIYPDDEDVKEEQPPFNVSPGVEQKGSEVKGMPFDDTSGLTDLVDSNQTTPWEEKATAPLKGIGDDYIADTSIMKEEIDEATKTVGDKEKADMAEEDKALKKAESESYLKAVIDDFAKKGPNVIQENEISKAVKKSFEIKGDRKGELIKFIGENWMPALGLGVGAATGGLLGGLGGLGAGYAAQHMALVDEDLTTMGLGLAGLGDALSSAYGTKTNYLGGILSQDLKEKELARKTKQDSYMKPYYDQLYKIAQINKITTDVSRSETKAKEEEKVRTNKEELRKLNSPATRMIQDIVIDSPYARYAVQEHKKGRWYKKPHEFEKWVRKHPALLGDLKPLDKISKDLETSYGKMLTAQAAVNRIAVVDRRSSEKEKKADSKLNKLNFRKDRANWDKKVTKEGLLDLGNTWRGIDGALGEFMFKKGYTNTPSWDWSKFEETTSGGKPAMFYDGVRFTFPRFSIKGISFDNKFIRALQDRDSRKLASAVQKLQNVGIKAEGGSNVTDNELVRQYNHFSQTEFHTTEEWLAKLKALREQQREKVISWQGLVGGTEFFPEYIKQLREARLKNPKAPQPVTAETIFRIRTYPEDKMGGYILKKFPSTVDDAVNKAISTSEDMKRIYKDNPMALKKEMAQSIARHYRSMPNQTEADRINRERYLKGAAN